MTCQSCLGLEEYIRSLEKRIMELNKLYYAFIEARGEEE